MRTILSTLTLLTFLVTLVVFAPSGSAQDAAITFQLAYTGDLEGYQEPCG